MLHYVKSFSLGLHICRIFGYLDINSYVAGLKMGRGSLLHSTNIYHVLLRGMNYAWECRSGQDRPGFCLQQPRSPETHSPIMTEKKRCTSLRRYRWGQRVEGDVPEVQERVWSLRDGCGNTKCGAGGWRAWGRAVGAPLRDLQNTDMWHPALHPALFSTSTS